MHDNHLAAEVFLDGRVSLAIGDVDPVAAMVAGVARAGRARMTGNFFRASPLQIVAIM
jgi:hypothetical protein